MRHVPAVERREQLITAVIAEVGVEGASTRRIAQAAGAPLATLHYCFESKERLFLDVFDRILASHRAGTALIEGQDRSMAEVAGDLLTRTLEWGMRHLDQARAELDLALWAERQESALGVHMYAMFADVWARALQLAAPDVRPAEILAVVRLLMALADGLGMQMLAGNDDEQTRRDTSEAGVMLAAYLRARHRRP